MEKQNAIVEEATQSVEVEELSSRLALLFLTRPASVVWGGLSPVSDIGEPLSRHPRPMMMFLIVNQSPCLALRCRGPNTICSG